MKYYELNVWQKAVDLSVNVYRHTGTFPQAEIYGLQSQMRRAAVSIPSNIAEGEGHVSYRERRRFLCIARGSVFELLTQVLIAQRLGYVDEATSRTLADKANEVGRLIAGSIKLAERNVKSRKKASLAKAGWPNVQR